MKFEMFKNLTRFAVMLAAVVVCRDAFAQNAGGRPGLLNRGRFNRPTAGQQPAGARPAVQPAAGGASNGAAATASGDRHALNWEGAGLDLVLQAYADELDKTYLKDPGVPNVTITLKSREGQKLTREEFLEAIEVILEMNGVHVEPYGERFIRVLPRKDARKEGIPLIMDAETKLGESGKVVSMMIPFKNISAQEEAQKALEGFKSNSGILLVFERTNSILVTDTEQNINRMLEIARAIDIATPVLENVFVRQIKNASAADIKTALEAIVQESQKELEKNGKGASNVASQNNAAPQNRFGGSRLLGKQNNQPQAPVNQASLVMTVSDADRGMIRGKVLIIADDRSNKLVIVTQKPNMDFFDKVIEQLDVETTPDTVVKVYRLKYAEAEEVSDMINDLIGNSGSSRSSGKDNQNRNSKSGTGGNMTSKTAVNAPRKSANQRSGEAKAGELTKDNTTVLADKRINGLVVMTEKELVPTIEQIIESMDIKLSQVLIETVIIEVTLGDGINTAMDWVQKGRKQVNVASTDPMTGANTFYTQRTTSLTKNGSDAGSSTTFLDSLVPSGYAKSSSTSWTDAEGNSWTKTISDSASSVAGSAAKISTDGVMNYYTAGTATAIGGGSAGGVSASIVSNLTSSAFNFIFDSDELGLKAILSATKTDSHSKYIASPIIMTLDNKEATIEATQMRYLFKGYQYSGSTYNGSAVPDYEQKELGITIKVTPKINPNGTVMLTLEEEYSQEGVDQPIQGETGTFNAATTVTRKMSADALLENNQTVIFAGLTETSKGESESGIPFLKDIPFVGKWLFGSVQQDESRTELLVFMTPYVLDDADAAEAEAIRRKKAVSDQHAWDDHGWSASKLADPVSKKEQLRRLKDEWKKQDEEREAKREIEKAKIDRAKKLADLSVEERKVWLKMHADELEEEKKKELEEKMLDKDSQEELKKLAEKIRSEKLDKAEKDIKEDETSSRQENERERLDREKAERAKVEEQSGAEDAKKEHSK